MEIKNKKICILGLGYIGLPTAALLAANKYDVLGVDINPKIVANINQGNTHIIEADLDKLLKSSIDSKKLKASVSPELSDIYIICVPTPFKYNKGRPEPDIKFIFDAVESISNLLKPNDIIILESTSPVGTTELIKETLKSKIINLDSIYIAYCPERVLPGKTLSELISNDRVVGGINNESTNKAAEFYKSFVTGEIKKTDSKTAEMCKLTENSFRDTNLAFANEISIICEKQGINVWNLIDLANRHPRVNILQPGSGVGGHCIAVDPWFIVAQNFDESKLIRTSREVNDYKPSWVYEEIIKLAQKIDSSKEVTIICFGATFKPDIDDTRESPAIQIIKKLSISPFNVAVSDPNIKKYDNLELVSIDDALNKGDIFVILVKHKEFMEDNFKKRLADKKVIDFCGALQP